MTLPLKDIKVLDFSHLLPGELTSALLRDLGAEVIRVERLQPGLVKFMPPIVKGESLYYWCVHRDEKRLGLDLKNPKGVEVARKLAEDADVLVENFRPGVMGRLGLGFGKIHAINPRLVYLSISSYGQQSAYAQRPGHDLNLQAETGTLWLSRNEEGRPLIPGTLLTDFTTALFAALSIVSGILQRNHTGKGRHLDVSMFDSTIYMQSLAAAAQGYFNQMPLEADPAQRADSANYNVFKCADGRYVAAAPLEPQFWEIFCDKLGRSEWKNLLPFGPQKKLREELDRIFAQKTMAQWVEIFDTADCCVSPVNTMEDAIKFLPVRERNLFHTLLHPVLGEIPQMRAPLPFDRKYHEQSTATADIVRSSTETLAENGYSTKEIEELAAAKVIPSAVTVLN
jgi:crotonobetainyl-CoA:carnitine CoA-transferase CaiB-like acyl-CoA transferase